MDERERRQFAEAEAVKLALNEAFDKHRVTGKKLLASYIKPNLRVEWQNDVPVVIAKNERGEDVSVDVFVAGLGRDADFRTAFVHEVLKTETPPQKFVHSHDQQTINANLKGLADGSIALIDDRQPPELDENTIDRSNLHAINHSIEDLAAGRKTISESAANWKHA